MTGKNVTLRLLDKADKEILKLPRPAKGAIYDFQHNWGSTASWRWRSARTGPSATAASASA
ncbi:hypothetical protein SUDANB15_06237 [Streptomyces sp. enrichment culture]|uniref:hypothetical protein n=1 Tax=Streptomyces sp. enrichment culture TaxID=1795815 RepID=UPI003F57A4C1